MSVGKWYDDCFIGFSERFARLLSKLSLSTQKSKARAEDGRLKPSSVFRAFDSTLCRPTKHLCGGHPYAEVPQRPVCGVRLTTQAGVFLVGFVCPVLRDESKFVCIEQHERQLCQRTVFQILCAPRDLLYVRLTR